MRVFLRSLFLGARLRDLAGLWNFISPTPSHFLPYPPRPPLSLSPSFLIHRLPFTPISRSPYGAFLLPFSLSLFLSRSLHRCCLKNSLWANYGSEQFNFFPPFNPPPLPPSAITAAHPAVRLLLLPLCPPPPRLSSERPFAHCLCVSSVVHIAESIISPQPRF